jgi:hypothetical protein
MAKKKFSKSNFIAPEARYIRVGVDYFKVLYKPDRYQNNRVELKRWKKEEITLDHSRDLLKIIPKYDDFILVPDNIDYKREVDGFYNLYAEFMHKPAQGEWEWTEKLLRHVFGEQYEIGLKYIQTLYLHPTQALPVLVLVSKERQTGKSTFIDWLYALFGANMVIISPKDLGREFNGSYSKANIIAIEETLIEKTHVVETVKAISTQKYINANLKNVNDFQIPFYGKVIMASNNERKFIKIDSEEIRFFVRKLSKPIYENHNILHDMVKEIPAFLHFLTTLPEIDFTKSRMVFTPDELQNECLDGVKNESKTWLYKELFSIFDDFFNNTTPNKSVIYATPKEIKERFFTNNSQVSHSFLKDVLIDEYKFKKSEKIMSYKPLDGDFFKTGTPFFIEKKAFFDEKTMQNGDFYDDEEINYSTNTQQIKQNDIPF